jgi:hypothetical protein
LHGFNPATGEEIAPVYHPANAAEVDQAAQLAHGRIRHLLANDRRRTCKVSCVRIAENIKALGDTTDAGESRDWFTPFAVK